MYISSWWNCSEARSPFFVITLVVICEEPIPEISCSAPNLTNCYAIKRNLLMVQERDVIKSKCADVLPFGRQLRGATQPWDIYNFTRPTGSFERLTTPKRWFTTDDESPWSILSFRCKFHAQLPFSSIIQSSRVGLTKFDKRSNNLFAT